MRDPVLDLNEEKSKSFKCMKIAIALCYDVSSGSSPQTNIHDVLSDVDESMKEIAISPHSYDSVVPASLKQADDP